MRIAGILLLTVVIAAVGVALVARYRDTTDGTPPSHSDAPSTRPAAETVYRTGARLEPDTAVAAWILTRVVSPGARAVVAESWPGSVPFDEPGTELARRPGRCASRIVLERFDVEDALARALAEVAQELEISPWSLNPDGFFEHVRYGLGDALNASADRQECLDAALTFLDGVREGVDAGTIPPPEATP